MSSDTTATDSSATARTAPDGFTAEPLPIPASLDDASAGPFHEMTALRNAVARDTYASDDFVLPAEVLLPGY